VFLLFLYVFYKRRYCDAKSESRNFSLRNVIVVPKNLVLLQLLTRECVSDQVDVKWSERENGRTESERENGRARERASERTGEPRASEKASLVVTCMYVCMYRDRE